MSTAPKPTAPTASSSETNRGKAGATGKSKARTGKASFKYGYRYVETKLPNGRIDFKMIPLTLEDVLHPRFGDVHVLSDAHGDDCNYLKDVLKDRYRTDPSVVVLSDTGIFWDVAGLKHHSPDLAVIFGVKTRKEWRSFHVKTEKVRPSLIIEVTSPDTRVNDVETKVGHYAKAGVPHFVIVDAREKGKRRQIALIAYRLGPEGYERQEPDDQGRAWLKPVDLWLGVRTDPQTGGDRVALIDPATGEEIGDYTALSRARAEAETRATEAETRATEAETRATEAETRAAADAAARVAVEERLHLVEAELRRLRGER